MKKNITMSSKYSHGKISVEATLKVKNGKIEISGLGAGNLQMHPSLGDLFPDLYIFENFLPVNDFTVEFDAKVRAYDSHGHARFSLTSEKLVRIRTYEVESNFCY